MGTSIASHCTQRDQACTGKCAGYGSRACCPPLIVIAVLSAAQESGR